MPPTRIGANGLPLTDPQNMNNPMRPPTLPGAGGPPMPQGSAAMPYFNGQYGYGQAPGTSGRGYYEQVTPAGSFAAAEWGGPTRQQFGQAGSASNPYIGMTSNGIAGQGSVMGYAQDIANASRQANPYLGRSSERAGDVGRNAYSGSNPYLQQSIDATVADATKGFQMGAMRQFDTAAQQSGSFGNTGVEQMRAQAMSDFGKNLGNTVAGMRMQDYTQQQALDEGRLNRAQSNNQFNAGLSSADLGRNLAGAFTGQGYAMQGLGQMLGAGQFDATMGNNVNQFNANLGANDLNRNSGLAQNLNMFNTGQGNAMSQFNAGQGNALGMFDAGQRNSMNQYNTGQANNMIQNALNRNFQGNENAANRAQNQGQFDATLDFNIDNSNFNRQMQGLNAGLNIYDRMIGNTTDALNTGTAIQMTPAQQWALFNQQFNSLAGNGGSTTGTASSPFYQDPLLGFTGGHQLGGQIFRP